MNDYVGFIYVVQGRTINQEKFFYKDKSVEKF